MCDKGRDEAPVNPEVVGSSDIPSTCLGVPIQINKSQDVCLVSWIGKESLHEDTSLASDAVSGWLGSSSEGSMRTM